MEIIRYVNRMMIIGLTEYNLTLADFIMGAELKPQERDYNQDVLFVRDIPIKIIIPDNH